MRMVTAWTYHVHAGGVGNRTRTVSSAHGGRPHRPQCSGKHPRYEINIEVLEGLL